MDRARPAMTYSDGSKLRVATTESSGKLISNFNDVESSPVSGVATFQSMNQNGSVQNQQVTTTAADGSVSAEISGVGANVFLSNAAISPGQRRLRFHDG